MKKIALLLILCLLTCNASLATTITPSKKPSKPFKFNSPVVLLSDNQDILSMQLSNRDAKTYATIFELQKNGDWHQADKFIMDLKNKSLMGHVLYQRYMHPTDYTSSFFEIKTWLYLYNDLPDADVIYDLAMKKKPKGQILSIDPINHKYISAGIMEDYGCYPTEYQHTKWRSQDNWKKVKNFRREIKNKLKATMPTRALERINTSTTAKDVLDRVEYDKLLTSIASGYLYVGKTDLALENAQRALLRSGEKVYEAYWVAGLASWKLKKYDEAIEYFSKLYSIEDCDPWKRTAAAYWNARMYKSMKEKSNYKSWLHKATRFPATFYGQLASYELGEKLDLNLRITEFDEDAFKLIMKTEAGKRAIYLINSGQISLAEKELMGLDLKNNEELGQAVLSLVSYANMAQMSLIMGSSLKPEGNRYDRYDFAIYPIPSWKPENGFKLDPSLIYSFIKQESRFKPDAVSYSGARGLMQLMPSTAKHITGKPYDKEYHKNRLFLPEHNMELGQKYLQGLLKDRSVRNSLIMLPIAYNSGPGTLKMWLKNNKGFEHDPLLFIETIPYKETRTFVKKVLANYWIYQQLLGEKNTTADEIIEGNWPKL